MRFVFAAFVAFFASLIFTTAPAAASDPPALEPMIDARLIAAALEPAQVGHTTPVEKASLWTEHAARAPGAGLTQVVRETNCDDTLVPDPDTVDHPVPYNLMC